MYVKMLLVSCECVFSFICRKRFIRYDSCDGMIDAPRLECNYLSILKEFILDTKTRAYTV